MSFGCYCQLTIRTKAMTVPEGKRGAETVWLGRESGFSLWKLPLGLQHLFLPRLIVMELS
eukprot:jgi/Botrbrau1/14830/Bobra.168_3s0012.1